MKERNKLSELILAIESSCDETAAAVVADGREVLSNIISSQIPIHERYGGVVPEIASRNHVLNLPDVIDRALSTAGCGFEDLSAVAVTYGPGLVGALLTGVSAAKAIASARNGAKTLLLERTYMLGGLGTAGLIAIYLPICDGNGRQVCYGIAEELLRLSVKHGVEPGVQARHHHGKPWFENGTIEEKKKERLERRKNHRRIQEG